MSDAILELMKSNFCDECWFHIRNSDDFEETGNVEVGCPGEEPDLYKCLSSYFDGGFKSLSHFFDICDQVQEDVNDQ